MESPNWVVHKTSMVVQGGLGIGIIAVLPFRFFLFFQRNKKTNRAKERRTEQNEG